VVVPGPTLELPSASDQAEAFTEESETLLDDLEALAAPVAAGAGDRRGRVGLLVSLLFLRMAETRGLERTGTLRRLADGAGIGPRLVARLRGAAERYGVTGLDAALGGGNAGVRPVATRNGADDALRALLLRLDSDADRDELERLPPDVLGRLYERSLGESAPRTETRKAHGAFYTPRYVVDYVLARTLGSLLDGENPAQAALVRVLDPACGSGAFLLGAYRRLLEWHRQKGTRLDVASRSVILQNAIFGVDLDAAAIEVAKLSLLLACFDDCGAADHERYEDLPRLDENLRVGHSLIDVDWKGARSKKTDADGPSILPFDWQRTFPKIFAEGGFDVVIGNPPYLSFGGRHAVDISKELRRYYADRYESGGWPTAHALFLERSVKLLSRRFVAFVVPDQVGHLGGYRSARQIAQREAGLVEVRYWGERVFRGVTTPALTIVLDKTKKGSPSCVIDRDGAARRASFDAGQAWSVSPSAALIERLRLRSFSLGKLVGDCGIRTTSAREQVIAWPASERNAVPVLEGKLVDRYGCRPPRVGVRLDSERPLFVSRPERYRAATFVIRQTASYPIVGPREHALYFRNSLLALYAPSSGLDVHYLVALLNSKLLRFVYTETVREARQRAFPQVKIKALQSLPLRRLDITHIADKQRHDGIVLLAKRALRAQTSVSSAQSADEERAARGEFAAIDREIDDVVYDLYELSEDERGAVERSVA
jgi:SAM-dependent methyltransferase